VSGNSFSVGHFSPSWAEHGATAEWTNHFRGGGHFSKRFFPFGGHFGKKRFSRKNTPRAKSILLVR